MQGKQKFSFLNNNFHKTQTYAFMKFNYQKSSKNNVYKMYVVMFEKVLVPKKEFN